MTLEYIQTTTEFQVFDRKSVKIDAKALAITIIAFANADGGKIALGVENDGTLTGVDGQTDHVNELLRAGFDFCVPSIATSTEYMEVTDAKGEPNHIIMMTVPQSIRVHANQADEVYYRVGDKSKKLNFEQRMQLVYAKGEHYYEDAPVNNARWEDLNMDLVADYVKLIGYGKGAEAYIRENGYVVRKEDYREQEYEALSGAAILLFGKNPQRFFQRAQVRVIRYDGTEAKVGTEMNVVKDEIFTGPVLKLTNDVLAFVKTQIKEHTYLGSDGLFRTDEQYPEFCWKEIIVNAICHRDYSILGTDIQVKMFDDHLTVESPGILPGLVRPYNIREMHFSRNPKIALYMRSYKLVKEFGEGVDRMFREMEEAGHPAPEYRQNEFMVYATIWQLKKLDNQEELSRGQEITKQSLSSHQEEGLSKGPSKGLSKGLSKDQVCELVGQKWEKIELLLHGMEHASTAADLRALMEMSNASKFKKNYLDPLLEMGIIEMTQPDSPKSPTQRYRLTENGRELLE